MYRLPGGGSLVISPKRQAKKIIMQSEGLSPRQWKRVKKQLMREAKAARTST